MNRDLIQQAFPNQPRMQAAFESLVADAEAATARVQTALTAITSLSGDAEDVVAELAAKQPKNATLDAISDIGTDPGVLEQVQPGIVSIRAIDTDDTEALMSRRVADTRYLGASHSALTADRLTTARNIAISGDGVWSVSFDGSGNVTSALTLATVNATTGTFGGATTSAQISVDGKGRITNVSAVTITPAFSSITGKPTTLAGYGITDAQGLNANLTAIAGLTTAADKMIYWTGAGAAALVSVPAAARTAFVTLSGTNTGDQTITLTGDVTGSGTGSFAATIATGAVTLAKIVNVATATVFYRKTAGTGAPEVQTLATLKTDLGLTGTNSGDQTITLTGDATGSGTGSFAVAVVKINGVALSGLGTGILKNTTTTGVPSIAVAADFPTLNQNTTGSAASLTTARTLAATGDVTWSGSFDGSANFSVTTTIANGAVTLAKMANLAANSLIGNNTGAGATPLALTQSQVLTFLGGTTGTGTLMRSISPTSTGILTVATDGSNGYFWSTGNANSGTGVGTFFCYDGTGGRLGALDWGSGTIVRKPFGFYGTAFTFNYGTGAATSVILSGDSTGLTVTGVSNSTGNQLISGTGAQGYATGSGGAVTQLTSKSTGVTLNKTNGQITMNGAALAASTSVSFTLTNSTIAATDVVNVVIGSVATTNSYMLTVDAVAAGSCRVHLRNISGGSLSEALVLNFAILKAVAA